MANVSFLLSGGWRVSANNPAGDLITRTFSALMTASTYHQQAVVLLPTVSEYLISVAVLSNPTAILMTATNTVRINFSGQASSVSAASASVVQFKEFFGLVSPSAALPSAIHLGNSGSDSATCTILIVG